MSYGPLAHSHCSITNDLEQRAHRMGGGSATFPGGSCWLEQPVSTHSDHFWGSVMVTTPKEFT